MVPDSCIDRGLSLAQWLKLIEETAAQPALKKVLRGKYTFIVIHFWLIFRHFGFWKISDIE
jgi:hypothetical protein